MSPRETLVSWLRDAHAMEGHSIALLETQISRFDEYPDLLPRLKDHLEESRDQQAEVDSCLRQMGEHSSTLKDASMVIGANIQSFVHAMSSDQILKQAIASNAFEHFEASSYRVLVSAAEACGEPDIARVCQNIVKQELAMADWIFERIPQLTERYFSLEEEENLLGR